MRSGRYQPCCEGLKVSVFDALLKFGEERPTQSDLLAGVNVIHLFATSYIVLVCVELPVEVLQVAFEKHGGFVREQLVDFLMQGGRGLANQVDP